MRNWNSWDQCERERWKKNENGVHSQFQRRNDSTCAWSANFIPLHPWVNYGFLPDNKDASHTVAQECVVEFLRLPACGEGFIGHLGCMCLDNTSQ
ncbi:unnamed protein product [Didymodactylos carnosus]|uniref:Uncharacterized protein n=1 Tax=Didymodactylos carnosus TaxID=1234261 RepID=A0A8S2H5Y9_9BILA|nr:unnamed protein product [Didymodactylos carnosus]CAF3598626.1 unnamed protein product [Didymodactylos carnosus]